jgi:hypothetical protein
VGEICGLFYVRQLIPLDTRIPLPECVVLFQEHRSNLFFGPSRTPDSFIHNESVAINDFIVNEIIAGIDRTGRVIEDIQARENRSGIA